MATLRIMMENTTRRALTASCLRTPPSSPMASPRDDTFSSTVRLFLFILHQGHPVSILDAFLTHPQLQFLSCSFEARTGLLEPAHFETFKKQAGCLEFPPHYHFVSTGELQLSILPPPSGLLHSRRSRLSDLCPDARQAAAEKTEKDEAGRPAAD